VSSSSFVSHTIASAALAPHISCDGWSWRHTAGRPGWPKWRQRLASSSCTQRMPAGLPRGMPGFPGMGELIEGAMQHAPQPGRQSIINLPDLQKS
jgi:hypothetical protein